MIVPYDLVSEQEIKWLNRVIFEGFEFPSKERLEKIRSLDKRLTSDVAFYYLEDDLPVSQVCYLIYAMKTISGNVKTGVPLAVGTLPNQRNKGYGKKVMDKVHSKMKENNCKFSILATSKRWIAHKWYEKQGYFDLATLDFFYGVIDHKKKSNWSIRNYTLSDRDIVSELFNDINKDNFGFNHRPKSFVEFRELWQDKEVSLKILLDGNEIIGFVNFVETNPKEISEINIKSDYSKVDWIRFIAKGELIINPSPHQINEFSNYPFLRYSESDAVLMIKDLDENLTSEELMQEIGVTEEKFTAHYLDRY